MAPEHRLQENDRILILLSFKEAFRFFMSAHLVKQIFSDRFICSNHFTRSNREKRMQKIKGAYWIIQRFLVHYKILHLSNIAIAILDFSLLLPRKLSLFQLLRQQ
jgi:hypothetical protein